MPSEHRFGTQLTKADYQKLERCGISRVTAEAAVTRADEYTGREVTGNLKQRLDEKFQGLLFFSRWPHKDGTAPIRTYLLRRDSPPLEERADGKVREGEKYLAAPGSKNELFLPPGVQADWLTDPSLDLIIAEGPKKTLALHDLMWRAVGDSAERPRALVVGIPGASNFRGKKGKRTGPKGEDEIIKSLINDFDRLTLKNRKATLVPDADVQTNENVCISRNTFAKDLRERGARPFFVDIPLELKLKGIDDVIGGAGPDKALEIINSVYDPKRRNGKAIYSF